MPESCSCDYSDMPSPVDPACPQHGVKAAPGEWVEVAPMTEGQCSYAGCTERAIWQRKDGWMVAPGSPPGAVCETHHCWELIVDPEQVLPRLGVCGVQSSDRCAQPLGHTGNHGWDD